MSKKLVVLLVGFEKVEGDAPSVLEDKVDGMLSEIPEEVEIRYCKAEVDDHDENDGKGIGSVLVEFTVPESLIADDLESDSEEEISEDDYNETAEAYLDKFLSTIRDLNDVTVTVESTSTENDESEEEEEV